MLTPSPCKGLQNELKELHSDLQEKQKELVLARAHVRRLRKEQAVLSRRENKRERKRNVVSEEQKEGQNLNVGPMPSPRSPHSNLDWTGGEAAESKTPSPAAENEEDLKGRLKEIESSLNTARRSVERLAQAIPIPRPRPNPSPGDNNLPTFRNPRTHNARRPKSKKSST